MQKKIIALAVAGLVSGVAFAQTNVTVYGIVDMGYVYKGSHVVDGVGSYSGIDDGGWDSSRFGLKGTEDLGNGLSANFVQEFGTQLDRNGDAGVASRNSYLSLAGKTWGEVKAGSFGSVHDDLAGFSESGGMGWGNDAGIGLLVNGDAYNAVEYVSPNFSGLTFKAGLSSNYQNAQDQADSASLDLDPLSPTYNTVVVDEANNRRAFFANAAYVNGPLKIGVSYDQVNEQSSDYKKNEFLISGGYDFGVVKVGAAYDRATADNIAVLGGADATRDAYRVTIGAPIGANGAVALAYEDVSTDFSNGLDDNDASSWGVSYSHFLSKRTAFYATAYMGDFENGALTDTGSGSVPTITGYETGVKFGVRHTF